MATKITEKYEFLTQILTSYDGSEQRNALRVEPRHYITYDYYGVTVWESQWLRMLMLGSQANTMYIPLWHIAHDILDDVPKGATSYRVDTSHLWGYRNVLGIFMYREDTLNGGEAYKLSHLTSSGNISLTKGFLNAKVSGADKAVPMLNCYIQPDSNLSHNFTNDTNATLNFEVLREQTAPNFPAFADYFNDEYCDTVEHYGLPVEYNGLEVFRSMPAWVETLNFSYEPNMFKLDNSTGNVFYDKKSQAISEKRVLDLVLLNRPEINNLIRFFFRSKGRLKPFYAPTWVNDLEITKDINASDDFLLITITDTYKYLNDNDKRKKLCVFLKDNTVRILDINAYSYQSEEDKTLKGKIYLSKPVGEDIPMSQINMISFFCKYRLDNDTLQLDYETTTVATTKLEIREVKD